MAFQEVGNNGEFVSWKDKSPGDIGVEGWYIGKIKSVNFDHDNYVFLQKDGTKLIVNHCGYVARAMDTVKVGDYCQMIYMGVGIPSAKAKYKANPPHMVRVLVDPEMRAIIQDGLFIGMAPKVAGDVTTPITTAAVATQPVAAPLPAPAPAVAEDDDLNW
jgi:hypothetical protein